MKYGLLTVSVVYMSEMLLAISQFHLVYMLARFNYSDGQLCDLSNDYCTKCEALGSQRCGKRESHMYIHGHSHSGPSRRSSLLISQAILRPMQSG